MGNYGLRGLRGGEMGGGEGEVNYELNEFHEWWGGDGERRNYEKRERHEKGKRGR